MFRDLPILILEAGGMRAVVITLLSLAAILWGVLNFIRRHGRPAIAGQLCASMLPALLGLFCFCRYLLSYAIVAHSEISPQAAAFHQMVREFLAIGFLSLVGTVVSASLGVMCLFENRRSGVYCGWICYGLPVLLIGAGLTWGQWRRMIGMVHSGNLRWDRLRVDEVTQLGGLMVLIGGVMVFAGVRGLVVYRRRLREIPE